MVHSTPLGAFRPAPPRDIYNANIQIRSQRSTAAVVGISHRAIRLPRRRARKEYLLFKFEKGTRSLLGQDAHE